MKLSRLWRRVRGDKPTPDAAYLRAQRAVADVMSTPDAPYCLEGADPMPHKGRRLDKGRNVVTLALSVEPTSAAGAALHEPASCPECLRKRNLRTQAQQRWRAKQRHKG